MAWSEGCGSFLSGLFVFEMRARRRRRRGRGWNHEKFGFAGIVEFVFVEKLAFGFVNQILGSSDAVFVKNVGQPVTAFILYKKEKQ